ncbi:FadR/GntR family transcriptional regulator [Martelella sp. HB161492]|uniref:FadR/GntR family transcriptional regulator n=1 Tax=Martelella sp. HB161492 TaxID=2720726 RepID=UPI00158FE492|nr:FadR/GntR family transcriptional regulator [Martelella sp. HB161492]
MTDTETLKPAKTVSTRTRVSEIADDLRRGIEAGRFRPGDRLPSESELTRQHAVSRTVVREAFALLRTEGLVEARKGSGVFALDPAKAERRRPFADLDMERLSGVIELFELRSAFEIAAAGLAAGRRSAAQIDAIVKAHEDVVQCFRDGRSPREADFAFHYSIAQASQNKRFPEFLSLIRPGIVPRVELEAHDGAPRPYVPNPQMVAEHERIVDAIIEGNVAEAEAAMKVHLEGSLGRYRAMLKSGRQN